MAPFCNDCGILWHEKHNCPKSKKEIKEKKKPLESKDIEK